MSERIGIVLSNDFEPAECREMGKFPISSDCSGEKGWGKLRQAGGDGEGESETRATDDGESPSRVRKSG